MPTLKKLCAILVSLGFLYYVVLVACGLMVRPTPADIAVVLGNEVLADGTPSVQLAARLDCAIALYKNKVVKRIMASGGVGASGFDEASVMAAYLYKSGVAKADVIIDSAGINTMATAVNAAALMKKEHLANAVIVTQYWHIPRTQLAFSMAAIENYSADYPLFFALRDIPSTLREMVAIPVYFLTKPRAG